MRINSRMEMMCLEHNMLIRTTRTVYFTQSTIAIFCVVEFVVFNKNPVHSLRMLIKVKYCKRNTTSGGGGSNCQNFPLVYHTHFSYKN